jgi:hypothetical protein
MPVHFGAPRCRPARLPALRIRLCNGPIFEWEPFSMRKLLSAAVALAALATAGQAAAAMYDIMPANTLPDGSRSARLLSHGGAINPTVALSLNFTNMLDSPGWGVNLDNALIPAVQTPFNTGDFRFIFTLEDLPGAHNPLGVPGGEGMHGTGGGTGFGGVFGGHTVDVLFNFSRGAYDGWTQTMFEPGHNPPGFAVAQDFHFDPNEGGLIGLLDSVADERGGGGGALGVQFIVRVDGTPLSFTAAPEPASWTLMIAGFGAAGALIRRRRGALAGA